MLYFPTSMSHILAMKFQHESLNRRDFLKQSSIAATALGIAPSLTFALRKPPMADSLCLDANWESLNPGYWQVKDGRIRRRMKNYGDRARSTGFPFHYETHRRNGTNSMPVEYDPSLQLGVIYRKDHYLSGNFTLTASFIYHGTADLRREGDSKDWKMYQPGYGMMGIAFGAKSLFESFGRVRQASITGLTDDEVFGFVKRPKSRQKEKTKTPERVRASMPKPGAMCTIKITVRAKGDGLSEVTSWINTGDRDISFTVSMPTFQTRGYAGIACRGLTDFTVNDFQIEADNSTVRSPGSVECHVCYPLGDSLKKIDGQWHVRFVALFASDGNQAKIRITDTPNPFGGWAKVPVAGAAQIVNHEWRRNTAIIHATLPANPADKTLFYTVWKDNVDVTADPRIGSDGSGPGTGFVGDVPASGQYVGRLPQLKAPYKLCGLSCHALTSGLQQRTESGWKITGGGDDWQFRDQPTVEAYKHLDDYNFQIMVWEDDVWYMELLLYPPSTDDAYRVVTYSIAGPTSRWQMMRHWNVINPGDHDYGMDDVKGPEQIVIRKHADLGQDPDYMRRNFQIVHHLVTGEEEVDPLANPKKWRAWKMPNRDFTLGIVDARLWRSSQDTAMWDDEGWGHHRELYDRADPTRALLGEEQYAWLSQLIKTDSSKVICFTGLNGLHTIWTGGKAYSNTDEDFAQRDRVAADYAGWVAAGADRVIELLGSRSGLVTVYGDVHNGSIIKNTDHGVIECSFGPIGRSGGRSVIEGFGPRMKDVDGRPLEVNALYHKTHADPKLNNHAPDDPFYWNFLEMEFDPARMDPAIGLRVRNMVDAPGEKPRGGAPLETKASMTGRTPTCALPEITTLPNADVRFATLAGVPIQGTRSDANGKVHLPGLIGPTPRQKILLSANDGSTADGQVITTSG